MQTLLYDGDIIYTTCHNIPACYHVGIAIAEPQGVCIYNNTPTTSNAYGGNVVAQPLADFMQGRSFIKALSPPAYNTELVRQYAYNNRHRVWSASEYNCEDFVNEAIYQQAHSPLRNRFYTAIAAALIFL